MRWLRLIGQIARRPRWLMAGKRRARTIAPAWIGLEPLEPRVLPSVSFAAPGIPLDMSLLGSHSIVVHDWHRASVPADEMQHHAMLSSPSVESPVTPAELSARAAEDVSAKGNVLETSEAGGQASFSVALDSQPLADVVIPVAVSDPSEGVVSTTELVFTSENWDKPQTITVTGVDDDEVDGDAAYLIALGPAVSDDPGLRRT